MDYKGQSLETIPLELKNGKTYTAARNGNNAAWLCVCGYRLPLLWGGNQPKAPTGCPQCGKVYRGEDADKPQGSPRKICELNDREFKVKTQAQIPIAVEFDGDIKCSAIRVGNGGGANAAWLCVCGYWLPLIWSQFQAKRNNGPRPYVICGGCEKIFTAEGAPDKIKEVN